MSARVLLATCAALPGGDEDGRHLVAALAERGLEAEWRDWDDSSVAWNDADLVAVRSTWDYICRREHFLRWASGVARLANSAKIIAWNSHKGYLRELAASGIATVPTRWLAPAEPFALPDVEMVIKPAVGAGACGAGRFDPATPAARAAAREHVRVLHGAGQLALVQPYIAGVERQGETALIYFDGAFSHAVRKAAMLERDTARTVVSDLLYAAPQLRARNPTPTELAVGQQVLDLIISRGEVPLYARIDLLPGRSGPVVGEVELTEPRLYLNYSRWAVEDFADVIAKRTQR